MADPDGTPRSSGVTASAHPERPAAEPHSPGPSAQRGWGPWVCWVGGSELGDRSFGKPLDHQTPALGLSPAASPLPTPLQLQRGQGEGKGVPVPGATRPMGHRWHRPGCGEHSGALGLKPGQCLPALGCSSVPGGEHGDTHCPGPPCPPAPHGISAGTAWAGGAAARGQHRRAATTAPSECRPAAQRRYLSLFPDTSA